MATRSLRDRWALVTGSSRGIGQQIAWGLARWRCNVIVHGRRPENTAKTVKELERHGIDARIVAGDFGTEAGLRAVIDGVLAGPGYVDILYNNAAVMNAWQPVWEISRETWVETLRVNVLAMIALCNAFAPGMRARGYGRIINLTSGIVDTPNLAPYGVSKAAVDKYTKDLAAELRGTNVLVNTLDPGWLRTDMGGPHADHDVTTVLPGALVPALLDDHGASGQRFAAQDFRTGSSRPRHMAPPPSRPRNRGDTTMGTYVLLTKLTPDVTKDIKDRQKIGKKWMGAVSKTCPDVKWVAHYALLGPYDFMDIFEAPNEEIAAKVSMITLSTGASQAESWTAIPYSRFLELVHEI